MQARTHCFHQYSFSFVCRRGKKNFANPVFFFLSSSATCKRGLNNTAVCVSLFLRVSACRRVRVCVCVTQPEAVLGGQKV